MIMPNSQTGKKQRKIEKDERLLSSDRWLARNGHTLTYAGIFLFTLILYFRPYEWIPALSSFNSMAFVVAVATLLVYLPTQFSVEGSLTALPDRNQMRAFFRFLGSFNGSDCQRAGSGMGQSLAKNT
jgi:hypothetical protein